MSVSNIYATDLNGVKYVSVPKISVGEQGIELRNDAGAGELTVNSTGTELYFNGAVVETGGIPVWVGTAQSNLDMANYDILNATNSEAKTFGLRDFNTGVADGTGISYKVGEVVINQNTSVQGALSTEQVKVYDNPSGTFIELAYDKLNETLDVNNSMAVSGDVEAITFTVGTSTISQVVAGPVNVSGAGGLQSSKIIANGGPTNGVFIGTYPSDVVQLSYNTTTDVMEITQDTTVQGDLTATNLSATTNVGASTVSATTSISAPTVIATNVALKDNLNLYTQLAKSSNQKFVAYGNTLGGAPDTAVLDDINNKPTLALAGGNLSLNAKDVLGNATQLSSVSLTGAFTGEYIPLTGTLPTAPVSGAVVFQNGSSNLQCDDIQTSLITANAPFNFISVESPLQTKLLGVRSEDGASDPRILMALSESSVAPNILSMEYDLTAQLLKVNKGISSLAGDITSDGNFLTTNGDIQTENGDIKTINGNIEAPSGNITSTTGSITTISGDIGTTDGNVGSVNGNVGSVNGNVSGVQLQAGASGIISLGPLNLDPTMSDPQSISGVRGIVADEIIQANSFLANDTLATIGSASYSLKTTDALFSSQAGTVASITYPDPTEQNAVAFFRGALSIEDPPNGGLPAQIIVNGVPWTSGVDWSASPATSNVDMATYEISNAGAIASTSLSASDFITSSTTITGLDVVATNSLSVGAGALNVEQTLDFKPNATLYVAKNGNDTTGNGSSLQPYLTIQKAYDVAKLTSSSANIFCINIASGHYTENLNIVGKTYVWFVGSVSQSEGVGETTEIIGSITINANIAGGDDLYNKVCGFVNLQITGSITVSSSNESSLVVKNCKFYSTDRAIYVNPSATDYRTYINNSYVAHQTAGVATNPLIEITQGWLYATGGSWTALNNSSILSISGTGTAIQVGQITMESDNSSASLAPLVSITTTNTTTNTFGQCAMIAISATVKTTPAILINSATPPTLNLLQNYFGITGTSAGGNVIQYSGTAPTLQIGGNASQFGTSAVIQSGITSVSTTGVGNNTFSAITSAVSSLGTASATSLNAGSGAISGGAISGTTLTTTGAIKSSGTLQLSGNVISNASNTTSITGLNSITMAGTTPSITGANSITITNTNATVPLTINNNADNPSFVISNTSSTTIPCEFQINNGIISAIGNINTDLRGSLFFFTNGKDILRCPSTTMRLQMNYSPYAPTLASSAAAGAWVAGTGAFVSGVPKLLGTETITLSNLNFPIIPGGFGTQYHLGLNGTINTCVLNGAHIFQITATYTRTRSGTTIGPYALYGCSYPIESRSDGAFYSPINGTTYNEAVVGERITFTHGDVLAVQIYATYVGGSPPSITTPATGLSAVFSPFLV